MQPQEDQNYWQPSAERLAEPEGIATPEVTTNEDPASLDAPITWQASEYVHHEKDGTWFLILLAGATTLLLVDIFLIKSWTFGILIVVMAIAAIVIARRPPITLNYSLTAHGVHIEDKTFNFYDFRSFGIIQEGAFYSLRLIPNKRFMPAVNIFFPTELGEAIVDRIGSSLPMQPIERDPVDILLEKIRF